MRSAIDTLYYQWATDDEDRLDPRLLENIEETDLRDKLDTLQGVMAYLTTNLVEAQLMQNAVVDTFVAKAVKDEALTKEFDSREIEEAISELPEVVKVSDAVEEATKELDTFSQAFTSAIVLSVDGYEV